MVPGAALARGDEIRSGARSKERHFGTNHTNDVTQIWGKHGAGSMVWAVLPRALPCSANASVCPTGPLSPASAHGTLRTTVGSTYSAASATHACDTHNRASFSLHGGWFLSHLQNED